VNGKKMLLISERAYKTLDESQLKALKSFNEILTVSIPTIEQVGGASVGSLVAGVFLPK
jgi:arginine N-succinyltransferase